ncbi:MAG: transporter associated domain-containing protein [Isosphaeraceae bacterium]
MLDILGRLAKTGDTVEISGHRLTVVRADPTRIRRIRIEPIERAEVESEKNETEKTNGM